MLQRRQQGKEKPASEASPGMLFRRAWAGCAHLSAHGGVLLLEQRAQLLVQVARLLRQLRVPQAHPRARLINQVNGLRRTFTKVRQRTRYSPVID